MAEEYADEIAGLEKTLESLIEQRTEINHKIQHLKQAIENLAAAQGTPPNPAVAAVVERQVHGLTSSIEQILDEEPRKWKTTGEMRRLLNFYGVSLAKYANASAVIRTVLERLVKRGYAKRDPHSDIARYRRNMQPIDEEIGQAMKGKKK